ncbi:hypothetical protein QL285_068497 [Trifolium repens]|nr:hypothetical protein QL285_068497 [Trifolium repens]
MITPKQTTPKLPDHQGPLPEPKRKSLDTNFQSRIKINCPSVSKRQLLKLEDEGTPIEVKLRRIRLSLQIDHLENSRYQYDKGYPDNLKYANLNRFGHHQRLGESCKSQQT